ncbi:MAG: MMPL family transporter [Actinomycetota bacterium]
MPAFIERAAALITGHPRRALAVLAVVVIAISSGTAILPEQADNSVFLPPDSDVANAEATLGTAFPDSAGLLNVTILHEGDVFTPDGLAHVEAVTTAAVAVPDVADRLAIVDPVISVAGLVAAATGQSDLEALSQEQVDASLEALRADPVTGALLDDLTGTIPSTTAAASDESAATDLVITSIRLRELGDPEGLETTELRIADIAESTDGPLAVSVLSAGTINDESNRSSQSSMQVLMLLALAVIAVLLFVFFRTGSDVLLTMAGLAITIVGTLGAQGWMGPDGLGLIGQPNQITTMIPIMLIGLVVDYAIQSVSHYRELRLAGSGVVAAARHGLAGVMLPLGLAAITTVISFMTNLISPIPANQDFGVVAAFGVAFGLGVMLVLVPAARTILDERRERADVHGDPRPMSDAIPGAGDVVAAIGGFAARKPIVMLGVTGVATVALGLTATAISTEFDPDDFLPGDSQSIDDIETLDVALGGRVEVVTILVEADLTDDRTLRNLFGLSEAFGDDLSRPTRAAGDITQSLGLLFEDWLADDGPGDERFDSALAPMVDALDEGITVNAEGVQELLDRLRANDPVGFDQVANQTGDIDRTILQFNALTGDPDRTQQLIDDVEGLWFGDRDQIVLASGEVSNLEITDSMTSSQTDSIIATVLAALLILTCFFGLTQFRPMLAVIAVLPIVLVLLWILGTMTILGIPYNVVTALITALSIGIGVDYTIHIIHRFTEELEHGNDVATATRRTLTTTGSALVGSALTTALGFSVLLFSPLAPFQQFGLVTAIVILYALIAAVAVVPPMLVVWAAYHEWRRTMMQLPAPTPLPDPPPPGDAGDAGDAPPIGDAESSTPTIPA